MLDAPGNLGHFRKVRADLLQVRQPLSLVWRLYPLPERTQSVRQLVVPRSQRSMGLEQAAHRVLRNNERSCHLPNILKHD